MYVCLRACVPVRACVCDCTIVSVRALAFTAAAFIYYGARGVLVSLCVKVQQTNRMMNNYTDWYVDVSVPGFFLLFSFIFWGRLEM